MEPHAGQLVVTVFDHIFDGVKGVVQLDQQFLRAGVIKSIHGHQVHVVEGEILELCIDEVILLGVAWHHIGQVQAIMHHGGPVQAEAQEAEEKDYHGDFAFGLEEEGCIFVPGKAGEVPIEARHPGKFLSQFGLFSLGEEVACGARGGSEELGAIGVCRNWGSSDS